MRMPFERLMEYVAGLGPEDAEKSMGELAAYIEEPVERVTDAIMAVRVMRGERTYISPVEIRAQTDPVVARAAEEDRRGVAGGSLGDLFDA